jgi:hypothetical protein
VLHNARAPVRGPAALAARSTLDGAVLAEWRAEVELQPGERRVVLEADLSPFDPRTTLLVAAFAGTQTTRLLAEPRDAQLAAPELAARREGAHLVVRASAPVIDLFLWDVGGGLSLAENFVTLPAAGELALPASGTLRGALRAPRGAARRLTRRRARQPTAALAATSCGRLGAPGAAGVAGSASTAPRRRQPAASRTH